MREISLNSETAKRLILRKIMSHILVFHHGWCCRLYHRMIQIQCGAIITRSALFKTLTKTPLSSSPVRARYGVSVVSLKFVFYSASVGAVLYENVLLGRVITAPHCINWRTHLHWLIDELQCIWGSRDRCEFPSTVRPPLQSPNVKAASVDSKIL